MKILVPVKRVADYTIKIRIESGFGRRAHANVKVSMNPFDGPRSPAAARRG